MNKIKTLIISILSIIAIAICAVAAGYYSYVSPNFSVPNGEKARIFVDNNCTIDSIVCQMEAKNWIKNSKSFRSWAKKKKYTVQHTGCYEILDGMSNQQVINMLKSGTQTPVSFTLNNVRTRNRLAQRIGNQLMMDSAEVMNLLSDNDFLKKYNVDTFTVVGMFIPNSYEMYWNVSAQKFFDKMAAEYNRFWNENRLAKARKIGLTPMEVSTLASIVDEETRLVKDKPIIAGLYINRLRRGMPLQACPTAKFASGDFSLTQILYKHTQIDSPYNTYKYKGLPPGPIRMPSIDGIDAVLNYTKSDYIFMCAKETLNGEHNFAATLAEHNQNSRKYHKALKEWKREKKRE